MATSKYLTGTISGLLFVTKIYDIFKSKFSYRDLDRLGEGDQGFRDRTTFSCLLSKISCLLHARNHTQSNIWDRRHIFSEVLV